MEVESDGLHAGETDREPEGNQDLLEEVYLLPSELGEKDWLTVLLLFNERAKMYRMSL